MVQDPNCAKSINSGDLEEEAAGKKNSIFLIKKYHRNGLLEKKEMKNKQILNFGKWKKDEHLKFIKASLRFGPNWKKLKEEIVTRTHAQIRSHAQKYFIKLCKKYNIEIKSKRKENFSLGHLNFPYKRKTNKYIVPLEKISKVDLRIIKNFNFYVKKFDLNALDKSEIIFCVEKANRMSSTAISSSNNVNKNMEMEDYFVIPDIKEECHNNSNDKNCSINDISITDNKATTLEASQSEDQLMSIMIFLEQTKQLNEIIINFLVEGFNLYNNGLFINFCEQFHKGYS